MPESVKWPNKPKTDNFLLQVPYNNQNDNSPRKGSGPGSRQCNITCAAMLAQYFYPSVWSGYQDFANGAQDILAPFGDTTNHTAVTRALETIGIKSYFTYSASMDDISRALFLGTPVIIGTKYKVSGHMVLLIGRAPGKFVCHNPYGSRAGTSDWWNSIGGKSGEYEVLSAAWMQACFVDGGPEAGWARFVTHFGGVPTGVKSEL